MTGVLPRRLTTIALPAAALAMAAAAWAAPSVVGIAAAIINDVRIRDAGTSTFDPAKVRERVALADQVRTGERSRLQLLLLDRTKFTVGANARLTIDRFVYDPNGGSVSASVAKGAFRFMSGTSRKAKKSVNTPSATIGIRGTVFDGVVGEQAVAIARGERAIPADTRHDPGTATLAVLRGPGRNAGGSLAAGAVDVSAAGETVALDDPLMAAYVPYAGAPPIGPFRISLPGLARLSDLIVPPPDRDFAPFDPDALPSRDDRPRGPPPGYYGGRGFPDGPGDAGSGGIPGLDRIPDVPRSPPGYDDRPPPQSAPQSAPQPMPTHSPNAPGQGQTTGPGSNYP